MNRFIKIFTLFAGLICGSTSASLAMDIQHITSQNGLEAWLVQDKTSELTELSFAFAQSGTINDPQGKTGTLYMVANLLGEGTKTLSALDFQKQVRDQSISLSFSVSHLNFSGSVLSLNRYRDNAINLLNQALTQPLLEKTALVRLKTQLETAYRESQSNPTARARKVLSKTLYPNSVFGRPTQGTPTTRKNISPSDLKGALEQVLATSRLKIVVVGNINPKDAGLMIDKAFANIPIGKKAPTLQFIPMKNLGTTKIVKLPIPQTTILFAQGGIARKNPKYLAAYVMNYILGAGQFQARLMKEIRVKRGLVYGVSTQFSQTPVTNGLVGYMATANKKTWTAIDILRQQWRKLHDDGIDKAELSKAQSYLTGSYDLRFSSTPAIASILLSLQLNGLSSDYITKRNAMVKALTVKDINQVSKTLLKTQDLTFVLAGNPPKDKKTQSKPISKDTKADTTKTQSTSDATKDTKADATKAQDVTDTNKTSDNSSVK